MSNNFMSNIGFITFTNASIKVAKLDLYFKDCTKLNN